MQERDQRIQQQSQEILDLSWKAKVAADWTEWWEHHSHEFTPLPQERPSTDRRRSRSRSVSTSVTRRTGRSVTPSQGSRRSVTPTRRGRVGPGPLGGLGEETLQEMEALEEYTLDSFDSIAEPTSQEVMVRVTGVDRDDMVAMGIQAGSHRARRDGTPPTTRNPWRRVPQEACTGRVVRPRTFGSKG